MRFDREAALAAFSDVMRASPFGPLPEYHLRVPTTWTLEQLLGVIQTVWESQEAPSANPPSPLVPGTPEAIREAIYLTLGIRVCPDPTRQWWELAAQNFNTSHTLYKGVAELLRYLNVNDPLPAHEARDER